MHMWLLRPLRCISIAYTEHWAMYVMTTICQCLLPVQALYQDAQVVADLSGEPALVQLAHSGLEGRVQPQQVLPLGHLQSAHEGEVLIIIIIILKSKQTCNSVRILHYQYKSCI